MVNSTVNKVSEPVGLKAGVSNALTPLSLSLVHTLRTFQYLIFGGDMNDSNYTEPRYPTKERGPPPEDADQTLLSSSN